MQIWPAIDLRGGKCVRLVQGDFDRETVFGEDPAAMAKHWVDQGASRLHLVDLDGARDGVPQNLESIERILSTVDVPCQLGGGIRDTQTISRLLGMGLARLVLGTSALKQPDWFREAAGAYPDRLVLGLDARDGRIATDGWRDTSHVDAVELARELADEPIAGIVYTDIATDGTLGGPNVEALAQMKSAVTCPVIASGGIASVEDVARLTEIGMDGCIIGRALYDQRFVLAEALAAAGDHPRETRSRL
ncbi:MAG: 1-(5-phosphoribosyl)-5-[(5-phosphoribosylamino)methylideneamino]imidazole-4-carboxamide isomerase [Pirellulales bacterium]